MKLSRTTIENYILEMVKEGNQIPKSILDKLKITYKIIKKVLFLKENNYKLKQIKDSLDKEQTYFNIK